MKAYLLLTGLLLSLYSRAQSPGGTPWLNQGQVQVGVGAGAGWGSTVGGYIRATPYAQYFVKDGLAVRLEGRYNYNGPDGNQYVGAGLSTQYHFLRVNRLSFFASAGYFYGQANYGLYRSVEVNPTSFRLERYRQQFNYGMLNLGLGTQYQVSTRWSINALAEKNIGRRVDRFGADGHSFTLGIGFRIK